MNGGSSNNLKFLMYVCCLDTNTKFQTNIKKGTAHMDLYQHNTISVTRRQLQSDTKTQWS